MLEKLFKLKEHDTTVKKEIIAGATTFLTMAYILAVNPNILGTVMNANGVFVATALASAIATFVMAFLANYPMHILHIQFVSENLPVRKILSESLSQRYLWKV